MRGRSSGFTVAAGISSAGAAGLVFAVACSEATAPGDAGASDAGGLSDGKAMFGDAGACPNPPPDVGAPCTTPGTTCDFATGECTTRLTCMSGTWRIGTVLCPPNSRCELAGGRCACDCDLDEKPGEGSLEGACPMSSAGGCALTCCVERTDGH